MSNKVFTAVFAQTPKVGTAIVTAAITGITTDTPTGVAEIARASAEGAILTRLTALPRATCTASGLCLFSSTDNGVTKRLIDSETMTAQAVGTTSGIAETTFANYNETTPYRMQANEVLYVGSMVALTTGIAFRAEYSDFSATA